MLIFKKIRIAIMCVCIMSFSFCLVHASTNINENVAVGEQVTILENGNSEIGIAIVNLPVAIARSSYDETSDTCSGYFYRKSDGEKLGEFKCTGYFNYDGSLCSITEVTASTNRCADGYKMKYDTDENQISPTYVCATGTFSLYKIGLFGKETLSSTAVINIYCNQDGETSTEFNSD